MGLPNPHEIVNGQPVPLPGPTVTVVSVDDTKNEDGTYVAGYVTGTDAGTVAKHLAQNIGPVTHMPGNGLILDIVRGAMPYHSERPPAWVSVDAQDRDPKNAKDLERFLADFYDCDRGKPADVEATHYTQTGNVVYAPGESPEGGQ